MHRNTCHWMTVGILSLALFSGETNATPHCKACNGSCSITQVSLIPQGFYLGFFGGGGSATNTQAFQRGTAFYPPASAVGGPLAVDGEAHVDSHSTGFGGVHLGYAWKNQPWCLTPAIEFEGFYMRTTLDGIFDAPHTALPEHTFNDSFPIHAGVFLINSVFAVDITSCPQVQVYLGGGIGGAVLSVSDADSLQINPAEPNVNHFNTKKSASNDAFAAQLKVGLNYTLTNYISLFAEYRFLYLGPTRYTFGSTVFPGHVPTAPWGVDINSLNYNLGAVGIQFNA